MLAGGGIAHTSGGVGTLMRYLMDEWAKQPDAPSVRVIDTRGQGGVAGGATSFLRALAMVFWLGATRRMALAHAHMTTRGSTVRKCLLCSLAGLLGVPVVVHMHGADFLPFYRRLRPAWQAMVRAVLRRAQRVIVLGAAWRDFLVDEVGVSPDRVAIVLNGVPCPDTSRLAARRAAAPADRPLRIAFLGRLGERKGVPELIEALGSAALRARAWHATIAGDGDVTHFRNLVAAKSLSQRIDMPGWLGGEDAASLLAGADLLVLPSHHEAMPIAVLEAMAFEVAVITTPVGTVPEFLEDGVSALLVPPGSLEALAGALARLIDDATLRCRIAAAGHAVFAERLDIRPVAASMLQIYRSAMHGDGATSGGTATGYSTS